MKTLKNLILGDWGPTMRGFAWALGYAVAIPAAVLIVMAQWLAFTWRRPLAGVLVLVPVQNPGALYGSIESISSIPHCPQFDSKTTPGPVAVLDNGKTYPEFQEELLGGVAQSFGLTGDELMRPMEVAPSSPRSAPSSPRSNENSPRSESVAPPIVEISPALDAALDQAIGLKRPVRPVGPDDLILAPGPRRQRRRSKQPQSPA